jgi:hypothetical protein
MYKSEAEAKKIVEALKSNDIVAEVIKFSAWWESSLDIYLAIEFSGPNRIDDFLNLVAPCMSMAQKIEALKRMKFHKPMKSHSNIIDSLTRVRKIRNKLAHAHRIDDREVQKIQSDRKLVKFILGYPESFRKERNMLNNSFGHLWRSWETRWKKQRAKST